MADKEKATPVTPDEIDDIRVTLDLDEGEVECKILTIFDVNEQDYIALMPLNPDGSDPDEGPGGPVTPVTPLPTPDPTPVPTPTPGDPGATETTTTPETESATETIEDDATPRTAPEPIDDDGTPLASGAHRDCWVHWLMLLGILVTVVYYGGVGVRRVRFSSSLQSFEDDVLGNDETNR